ncbi:hypothetical protein AC249_AIPGENE3806 [Exaiptasia diaphana]|nr:hypothetical protein AC249_AIPGENE3806 [Exaiptasia diaphana]
MLIGSLRGSQVSPDQMVMMPQQVQTISRLPVEAQASMISQPQVQQPQIQQRFFQNKPNGFVQNRGQNRNEYVGLPMKFNQDYRSPIEYDDQRPRHFRRGRHPLFRRRLHHRYYDDDDGDDEDYYDHDEQPLYHERLGRGRITIGGEYSENEMPNNDSETLLDTNNHGFGPITVEAKTAEGLKKSIGEDKRGAILKPKTIENATSDSERKKNYVPFKFGVL